jgi:hypothetical protein
MLSWLFNNFYSYKLFVPIIPLLGKPYVVILPPGTEVGPAAESRQDAAPTDFIENDI